MRTATHGPPSKVIGQGLLNTLDNWIYRLGRKIQCSGLARITFYHPTSALTLSEGLVNRVSSLTKC